MIHEIFPDSYIELNKELMTGLHPKLEQIIAGCGIDEIDLKLSHIAAYCEVMLDDVYSLQDRMKLCDVLREKLILKRENPNGILIIN